MSWISTSSFILITSWSLLHPKCHVIHTCCKSVQGSPKCSLTVVMVGVVSLLWESKVVPMFLDSGSGGCISSYVMVLVSPPLVIFPIKVDLKDIIIHLLMRWLFPWNGCNICLPLLVLAQDQLVVDWVVIHLREDGGGTLLHIRTHSHEESHQQSSYGTHARLWFIHPHMWLRMRDGKLILLLEMIIHRV